MNFPKKCCFFLPKNCIFRKSYFHHSEPRHGPVAKQGAASLAVLLHHGPGPEHEAMLASHLAAALVTHAAPLPAHVRLREPPRANSGSLRGQPLEEEKGRSEFGLREPPRSDKIPPFSSSRVWSRRLPEFVLRASEIKLEACRCPNKIIWTEVDIHPWVQNVKIDSKKTLFIYLKHSTNARCTA